ncbi:hypothetical protein AVEN_3775-1 [Araneus ventricosus]|uniref:Uncharacterized protein n=1 Tax=Araneus ventricosus TaxID=182803 RepID=A0A4Y2UPW2_ARAVE|nr:hypothetical protein AVEN_3775-1 [Araneus ventricosus]
MIEATPQHLLDSVALVYDDLLKRPDFVLEQRKLTTNTCTPLMNPSESNVMLLRPKKESTSEENRKKIQDALLKEEFNHQDY